MAANSLLIDKNIFTKWCVVIGMILLTAVISLAQESGLITNNGKPNQLLSYLFDKYGIDESESKLILLKEYELVHDIKIVTAQEYFQLEETYMARIVNLPKNEAMAILTAFAHYRKIEDLEAVIF